jgi:hypothetical protein
MKKIIKKFLVYLKALDLFRAYWQGLDYISTELKAVLIFEEKSVMKSRKKIVISQIFPMIKPKKWKRPFQSRHDGLNLFCRLDWIDRYLGDICKEINFELRCKPEFEKEWDTIIDNFRFEQFYGTFNTQYKVKENIFFEVFTSLVLSGIDPFDRKVVIMVDGENDRKMPDLKKFVDDDVYHIMKSVSPSVFTKVLMNAFGESKYTYRVFLEK